MTPGERRSLQNARRRQTRAFNKKYPEHAKQHKVYKLSNRIGEFIDWLHQDKGYQFCEDREFSDTWTETVTVYPRPESLLAEYFGIDLKKLDEEKRQMLDEIREANRRLHGGDT